MYVNENRANSFPTVMTFGCAAGLYGSVADDVPGSAWRAGYTINMGQIYPEYLTDAAVTLCPSSVGGKNVVKKYNEANTLAQVFDGKQLVNTTTATTLQPNKDFYPCESSHKTNSYIYFGWAIYLSGVTDSTEDPDPTGIDGPGEYNQLTTWLGTKQGIQPNAIAFGLAISQIAAMTTNAEVLANRQKIDKDYEVPNADPKLTIYRLREGIERFFITDINNPGSTTQAQSVISIMADWSGAGGGKQFNHVPGGANVLYMDGHVEFLKYPNIWPVSPLLARITKAAMNEADML